MPSKFINIFFLINDLHILFEKYFPVQKSKNIFAYCISKAFFSYLNIQTYTSMELISVQAVDIDVYMNTNYFQHHLLKKKKQLLFLYSQGTFCILNIHVHVLSFSHSGLIILFHWSSCLFLHKYCAALMIVTLQEFLIPNRVKFSHFVLLIQY